MDILTEKIKELLALKPTAVIAIDGMCASGKTTLAARLSEEFGFQIIHTDDFFLPPEMRTAERLSQAGGNIHYERFIDEVAIPLKNGTDAEYRVFSCSEGGYTAVRRALASEPIIIEGAYSTHPRIPDIYDLKIFMQIDSAEQLRRIEMRNGADVIEVFRNKWIPFENAYFSAFGIKEKCDFII